MASKVTFKINLKDLVDPDELALMSRSERKELREQISEYAIDKILEDTSKGRSAVTGQQWKGLNKDYKKSKSKIASSRANLELHGDMLNALKAKKVVGEDAVEIGIFNRKQAKKADGHCHTKVFGESDLPVRKFLPSSTGTLRPGIMKEIAELANDIVGASERTNTFSRLGSVIAELRSLGGEDDTDS